MLGHAPLGVLALGQLPSTEGIAVGAALVLDISVDAGAAWGGSAGDALARGALLPLTLTLEAGAASGEVQQRPPVIISGGGQVSLPLRYDAVAQGALITLDVSLLPGRAVGVIAAPEPPAVDGTAAGALLVLEIGVASAGLADGFDGVAHDNEFLLMAAA